MYSYNVVNRGSMCYNTFSLSLLPAPTTTFTTYGVPRQRPPTGNAVKNIGAYMYGVCSAVVKPIAYSDLKLPIIFIVSTYVQNPDLYQPIHLHSA